MKLWLNIPVKDTSEALHFYTAIGFDARPEFSSEVSESVTLNDAVLLMLVKNEFFEESASRKRADTGTHAEVVLATELHSKIEVDAMVDAALLNGASKVGDAYEHEGMYTRVFRDPDGHQFNVFTFLND